MPHHHDDVPVIRLCHGAGDGVHSACLATAVSIVAGEPWSMDSPSCLCRFLRSFIIPTNDSMSDAARASAYGPLPWELVGTFTVDREILAERALIFARWIHKTALPALIRKQGYPELADGIAKHPDAKDRDSLWSVLPFVAEVMNLILDDPRAFSGDKPSNAFVSAQMVQSAMTLCTACLEPNRQTPADLVPHPYISFAKEAARVANRAAASQHFHDSSAAYEEFWRSVAETIAAAARVGRPEGWKEPAAEDRVALAVKLSPEAEASSILADAKGLLASDGK